MRLLNQVPEKDRFGYLLGLQVERHRQSWHWGMTGGLIGVGSIVLVLVALWWIVSR